MHVLLIHQAFAGPDDPGGTRHYELGSSLVACGHRVTVIASAVNYLTGTRARSGDEGVPDGMTIVRIPVRENLHRSYWARATSFFAFASAALRAARAVKDVDVVWGTSPPLVQLLPAWLASRRCPGGLVFEERDLWPEFAIGMGVVRDGPLARAALGFKRFMYARARRIVVNSPGFLPFLAGYGVPTAKVRVVPNGVDVRQFRPDDRGETFRREWEAEDRFVVLYAGALGAANALETVLDAADTLRGTPALFVLAGDGKARPDLERAAAARALTNVRFVPAQPKRVVPHLIAAADACVATLRDIPLFRTTYPNKVFDYMAAGRPVLVGIDGVIRDVVERAQAGLFFSPGDGSALAARVREMMRDRAGLCAMGERGRRAVCDGFDRRLQAAQIEDVFTSVLSDHRVPRSGYRVRGSTVLGRFAGTCGMTTSAAKRMLDISFALLALIVASPALLLVALAVSLDLGAPVLFRQRRTGLHGRCFMLLKFRTMRSAGPDLTDAARLTPLGRLLRRLSLDELPQLWNVLSGDMSMVGPRPLLPEYLDRYTREQARRHDVLPGITGLAQVHGRNGLSWCEKFALDVWYVDHSSLSLDLKILWRTVTALLRGEGVSAPGCATMPEFRGESAAKALGTPSTGESCGSS